MEKQFENKVLLIKSEKTLTTLANYLRLNEISFNFNYVDFRARSKYVYYNWYFKSFCLGDKTAFDTEITMKEFKQLLKQEIDEGIKTD